MSTLPQHFEQLLDDPRIEDQSIRECSKTVNFYLTYKSDAGHILDPMIESITEKIEELEREESSDGSKPVRKKKRAHHANRRFKQAVKILILNLLQVHNVKGALLLLAVSKDANYYSVDGRYSPPDMTYDPFIEAYNGLVRLGYIKVIHNGYYNSDDGYGENTKVSAGDNLISCFEEITEGKHVTFYTRKITDKDKDELIILRQSGKDETASRNIDYEDTAFTNQARKNLKKINAVLARHEYDIALPSKDEQREMLSEMRQKFQVSPNYRPPYIDKGAGRLYRIFSENSFERGGRFYRGWWQNIPLAYRKYITIDGKPTVELDYSTYHISMAYALAGIEPPENSYYIHPRVSRKITKVAVNALLNAKGMINPISGYDPETSGMEWKEFVSLILKKHEPLNKMGKFMRGYGLTLQFYDSEIAEKIMLHFTDQDIPCLSIHDSFIVPGNKKQELEDIMKQAYRDKFGMDIKVDIKG